MPLPMERQNKAIQFLKGEMEVPDDFSHRDREFVALLLKNNQDLARCAADMNVSYSAVKRRIKDPGVAKLLNEIYADFNELVRYSLPRVFRQLVTNATFDPRSLIKASQISPKAFQDALDELTPEEAAAIQDWTFKDGLPVIKLAGRVPALDLLLRFFDTQRAQAAAPAREALGISVILRAPDGSTTEVKAVATPEAPKVEAEFPVEHPA